MSFQFRGVLVLAMLTVLISPWYVVHHTIQVLRSEIKLFLCPQSASLG